MRTVGSIVVLGGALIVMSGCSSGGTSESTPTESSAEAESGPTLDGTYKVEIGNIVGDTGAEIPQGAGTFDLVVRSACKDDACVATASAPKAKEPNALQAEVSAGELVFDYVDGRWIAVTTSAGTCPPAAGGESVPTDFWDSFVLEPKPDGTLSGEYTGRGSLESCAGSGRQKLTMTRTGDADPNVELPDPAAQPPRKTTPASGFRGRYQVVTVNVSSNAPPGTPGGPTLTYTAQTVCLRTGDRCLTYLLTDEGNPKALAFADGKWTQTSAPFPGSCQPNTGKATKVTRGEFRLPQAPSDPIVEVKGRVSEEALDGPCVGTSQFDNTMTRTGD